MEEKRGTWSGRLTFILAAIGSAVGLGNAWRFPGLAAKHGGGAFLMAYILLMVVFGIPLLYMEIAIGRKLKKGAPESMRGIHKRAEPIGWAGVTNAFVIAIYYAVIFAWVILMTISSFKFFNMTGVDKNEQASGLFDSLTQTTGNFTGHNIMSTPVFICLLIAWALIWWCIRNGASSVSKVVKYTVTLPFVCLGIMAIKGLTMSNTGEALKALFVPKWSALGSANLWMDAAGQVFYSLSIMMAIMFAYGSFLKEDSNIAVDAMVIAGADFLTSLLSGLVLFTTLFGVYGSNAIDMMQSTGSIGTAFYMYPMAIVNLSGSGLFNAIFAFIFFFCLCTLAIDSAFSIIEGVSTAISDKFKLNRKKTTLYCCLVAGVLSMIFVTGAGLAWLDVVDHWCNYFNLVLIGIAETLVIGWFFKTSKVLNEVNRNTNKFKVPAWWFQATVKVIAPVGLTALLVWAIVDLVKAGGIYGGYPLWTNFLGGWIITALVLASGFIVKFIVYKMKKKGFVENEIVWDENETIQENPVTEE